MRIRHRLCKYIFYSHPRTIKKMSFDSDDGGGYYHHDTGGKRDAASMQVGVAYITPETVERWMSQFDTVISNADAANRMEREARAMRNAPQFAEAQRVVNDSERLVERLSAELNRITDEINRLQQQRDEITEQMRAALDARQSAAAYDQTYSQRSNLALKESHAKRYYKDARDAAHQLRDTWYTLTPKTTQFDSNATYELFVSEYRKRKKQFMKIFDPRQGDPTDWWYHFFHAEMSGAADSEGERLVATWRRFHKKPKADAAAGDD